MSALYYRGDFTHSSIGVHGVELHPTPTHAGRHVHTSLLLRHIEQIH